MTARHEKKTQTHPAANNAVSEAVVDAKRREREREPWVGLKISIVIFFVLAGLKWKAEQTDFGKLVEQMTYDLLQLHLSPTLLTKESSPVIVLDISGIPMVPAKGLQPGLITARKPLEKIVDSLTSKEGINAPRAIGLDVDFSPNSHGYADPEDPALLDSLLVENQKVPIRVGVHDSLALGPEQWLRNSKYQVLASCVVVPNPDPGQSTRYMPEWLDVNYSKPVYEGITAHCPSLGVALIKATVTDVRWWLRWFAENSNRKTSEDQASLSAPLFLVDYSQLEVLSSSAKEIYDPDAKVPINVDVGGKIVLLGRTKNTTDTFTVPGRPEKPYPGVFLHACAAYTLSTSSLLQLTSLGRAVFDVLFPVGIFVAVFWIRLRRLKKGEEDSTEDGFPELLSFIVTLILVVGAIKFVRETRLMWDNFILVAVVLIVHPPLERATREIHSWLSARYRSWRHVFFPSPRSHSEGEK
jgi:CHASE2 domain-containing sensor protein